MTKELTSLLNIQQANSDEAVKARIETSERQEMNRVLAEVWKASGERTACVHEMDERQSGKSVKQNGYVCVWRVVMLHLPYAQKPVVP